MDLPEDKYIDVKGCKTRYWQVGEQGPYLLLVHGIGACCEYWYKNVFELAKNYRVVALDLPGFGKSDKPKVNYTLDYYSDFLRNFIDVLSIDRVFLIGHSMGGGLSLKFSIDHAPRVRKLILSDNVGFSPQVIIFFRLMGLPLIGRFFVAISKEMFRKALRLNVFDTTNITDDLVDAVYPLTQDEGARSTILQITRRETNLFGIRRASLKPLWDNFYKLKDLPILIFWGKDDVLLRCEPHIAAAKKRLPHAQIELLNECGHILPLEQAEKFNQKAKDFFEQAHSILSVE